MRSGASPLPTDGAPDDSQEMHQGWQSPVKGEPKRALFAVTSQGNDFYSAMTRVAVASLRVSNPNLRIAIACDSSSDGLMRQSGDQLIDEVDEWLVVDTPPGNDLFRNRYCKTKLRSLIEGPFLFLDSDIFVRGDLTEIFALDCDIAGARNHSRDLPSEQMWDEDRKVLTSMGWEVNGEIYINGGVLFYNSTEAASAFAHEWHKLWSESAIGGNYYRDQPALNAALYAVKPRVAVLPHRFNAQIAAELKVAIDGVIWHYYSSLDGPAITSFSVLVKKVLHGGTIDYGFVKAMVERRHPWRSENLIDVWAAKGIIRSKSLKDWEGAWLRREMGKYVTDNFCRIVFGD